MALQWQKESIKCLTLILNRRFSFNAFLNHPIKLRNTVSHLDILSAEPCSVVQAAAYRQQSNIPKANKRGYYWLRF